MPPACRKLSATDKDRLLATILPKLQDGHTKGQSFLRIIRLILIMLLILAIVCSMGIAFIGQAADLLVLGIIVSFGAFACFYLVWSQIERCDAQIVIVEFEIEMGCLTRIRKAIDDIGCVTHFRRLIETFEKIARLYYLDA